MVAGSQMFVEKLRKALNKTNEGTAILRMLFTTPRGNNFHRRGIFTAICLLTVIILGAIIADFGSIIAVVHAGSVEGLGVGIYWDQSCTNRTLSLDWGPIKAGSNNTLTVYVKNKGNSAVSLWLRTSNWTPSASLSYMSLNWNYSGQVLRVNQVVPLEITLTVYPTITGITAFSFDTIITATSES
jgi:hypothetical protein